VPAAIKDKDEEDKIRVFSYMQAELAAARDFSTAISIVRDAMDATKPSTQPNKTSRSLSSATTVNSPRSLKRDKKSKDSCKKKLKQCEDDATKPVVEPSPEFLFIQTGKECRIERKLTGSTDDTSTSYKLISDVGDDTFRFQDRPGRLEDIQPTVEFVANFNKIFETSNPNVGVTLVSEDSETFTGPIVVIASNPTFTTTDNSTVSYEIDQSPNQNGVISIESIFEETNENSVSFKDCSLFIDAIAQGFFC